MSVTELRPIKQTDKGYHNCGEQWGFMGEHRHYQSDYECPTCKGVTTHPQCAAWPISVVECPGCFEGLELGLSERTGVRFR